MGRLEEHLKILGLNDKQAACYIALVALGKATAYQVAGKAKLKRPITYIVLDELRRKGLVLKIPHAKKQIFEAKAPDELFAEYEEKLRYAKRSLPELLALAGDNKKVRVLYYEGKEGIQEALNYRLVQLANKEILAFYGKGRGPIPKIYFDYNKKLFDQNSLIRGFAPQHTSLRDFRVLDKKYGWNIRALPETIFSPEVSVEVADTFVRVLLYKDTQAVIIDNPDLARLIRQIFDMLWKNS